MATWNRYGLAPFPYLDDVFTGTGQCSCIHQIDQQRPPASYLLATSQWPVNEHQMTYALLRTNNQQIAINQQMFFLATTKQLYKWFSPSVCPSVRLSVTPFWLCSHHRIVMKFSGGQGQRSRSKVKVTEVITQLSRFRTVTPVFIHQWLWNDAESLKQHRRGALLFFKVIRQIWRSHRTKKSPIWTPIERFRTVT